MVGWNTQMTQLHHAASPSPDLIPEPQLPSLRREPNPFVVLSPEDVKRNFSNVRVVVAPPSADDDGTAAPGPDPPAATAAAPAAAPVPAAVSQPQPAAPAAVAAPLPQLPQTTPPPLPQAVHSPAAAAATASCASTPASPPPPAAQPSGGGAAPRLSVPIPYAIGWEAHVREAATEWTDGESGQLVDVSGRTWAYAQRARVPHPALGLPTSDAAVAAASTAAGGGGGGGGDGSVGPTTASSSSPAVAKEMPSEPLPCLWRATSGTVLVVPLSVSLTRYEVEEALGARFAGQWREATDESSENRLCFTLPSTRDVLRALRRGIPSPRRGGAALLPSVCVLTNARGYHVFAPANKEDPFVQVLQTRLPSVDECKKWWTGCFMIKYTRSELSRDGRRLIFYGAATGDAFSHHAQDAFLRLPSVLCRTAPPSPLPAVSHAAPRVDLRDVYTFSIDREGTQLFDDAVSVAPRRAAADAAAAAPEGWTLLVHVADPTEHVVEGSPLDRHLLEKQQDLFLPHHDTVDRMLPEGLLDATSLHPGRVVPALTVVLTVSCHGAVEKTVLFPSIVRSTAALYMRDDQDWAAFDVDNRRSATPPPPAALAAAAALRDCVLAMRQRRPYLQEATQGRVGPSQVVQHLMIEAKQVGAHHLARVLGGTEATPLYTVCARPHPDAFKKVQAVSAAVAAGNPGAAAAAPAVLDCTSEAALCCSLDRLRGSPEYAAVAKVLNMECTPRHHRRAYEEAFDRYAAGGGGGGGGGGAWERGSLEVGLTSPLRKYQDLLAVRALRTGRVGLSKEALVTLDKAATEKKRAGQNLKRLHWVQCVFGVDGCVGVPARRKLPKAVSVRLLGVDGQRLQLYDEVTNQAWWQGTNSEKFTLEGGTAPGGRLALRWKDSAAVAQELVPFKTVFAALLCLEEGVTWGWAAYGHELLSPTEEVQYQRFPPMLTLDSPEPYLQHCPFSPPHHGGGVGC